MRSLASVNNSAWCSRRYSDATTRNPAVPHAGSTIRSAGFGAMRSTMSEMMCRGVRNCPFCPDVASLLNMYS